MSEWKDATNYRRGEARLDTPDAWKVNADGIVITITRRHIDYPGEWIMHCPALSMDTVPLKIGADADGALAKSIARNMAASRAREIARKLGAVKSK